MTTKPLHTEFLFEIRYELAEPELIGDTPHGARQIFHLTGGSFEGPKLKGRVRPGGGDWLVGRADGVDELDVRATLETDDGALIYLTYRGLMDLPGAVTDKLARGAAVEPGEYYFRITPLFETASAEYGWLNRMVAVGVGEFGPDWVAYTVYAIL